MALNGAGDNMKGIGEWKGRGNIIYNNINSLLTCEILKTCL